MLEALSILSVVKIYMMPIILICDVLYASFLDLVTVHEATFISFVCTPCKHSLKTDRDVHDKSLKIPKG